MKIINERSAMLALHEALLQAQRRDAERTDGRMSAGQLLQVAAYDPRFVWLRELTALIARVDAGEATPQDARELVAAPDSRTTFGARYLRALQEHPDVVLAHRDLINPTAERTTA